MLNFILGTKAAEKAEHLQRKLRSYSHAYVPVAIGKACVHLEKFSIWCVAAMHAKRIQPRCRCQVCCLSHQYDKSEPLHHTDLHAAQNLQNTLSEAMAISHLTWGQSGTFAFNLWFSQTENRGNTFQYLLSARQPGLPDINDTTIFLPNQVQHGLL